MWFPDDYYKTKWKKGGGHKNKGTIKRKEMGWELERKRRQNENNGKRGQMRWHYYFTCEFFTPVLTGGYSPKYRWQKVSSGLQDSSWF